MARLWAFFFRTCWETKFSLFAFFVWHSLWFLRVRVYNLQLWYTRITKKLRKKNSRIFGWHGSVKGKATWRARLMSSLTIPRRWSMSSLDATNKSSNCFKACTTPSDGRTRALGRKSLCSKCEQETVLLWRRGSHCSQLFINCQRRVK